MSGRDKAVAGSTFVCELSPWLLVVLLITRLYTAIESLPTLSSHKVRYKQKDTGLGSGSYVMMYIPIFSLGFVVFIF